MPKSIPARIVIWQLAIGAGGAVISGVIAGFKAALAAFAGGAIGAILSLYFAIKVFSAGRAGRESDPRALVGAFYRAEALKFILAAGLFSLAAVFLADVWVPLIATFVASLTVYGFALIWKAGDGY